MSTLTLSKSLAETKRDEAIKNQSLIKRVLTRDLKLIDDSNVQVNGHTVKITKDAYKSLIKSLGLPQSFRLSRWSYRPMGHGWSSSNVYHSRRI